MNPDVALFHFLNNFGGVSPISDWLVRAFVNDYALPTLFALILGAFWFSGLTAEERQMNQRAILLTLIAIVVTNTLIRLLQVYYFRPRPFATEQVRLLFYRPSVSSFPSVPVATMFCYVVGLWPANKRVGRVLLALSIAFALSRVIAGVHYPLDVIGGALCGGVCTRLVQRYKGFLDLVFEPLIRASRKLNLA